MACIRSLATITTIKVAPAASQPPPMAVKDAAPRSPDSVPHRCDEPSPGSDLRTDEELMAAYIRGERSAFRELFARYAPTLGRMMRKSLFRVEDAEDLVQQTFLRLHRARLDFDASQRVQPWLFTIAMNVKIEYFRHKFRRPDALLQRDDEMGVIPTTEGVERYEASRDITRMLTLIPPHYREAIELHWFCGLSFPEVANALGETTAAVKLRAFRGYIVLRELLGRT